MSTIIEQGRKDVVDGVETTVLYSVPAERVPVEYDNSNTTLDVALGDVEDRLAALEQATPAVDDELTDNGTNPVEGGAIKQYVDTAVAGAEVNIVDIGEVAVFDDYLHDSATDAASAARAKDLNDRLVPLEKRIEHRGLRILNWNVLSFESGSSLSANMAKKWAAKLAQVNADIVAMEEYGAKGSGLFSGYVSSFDGGTTTGSNHNAVFSNFPLSALSGQSSQKINFTDVDGYPYSDTRYFTASKISIGMWDIVVISCHIALHENYKPKQIEAIINFAANYDRVIVTGDFNLTDNQLGNYDKFTNAGFKMANYDLFGRINTYPATGLTDSNYTTGYPTLVLDNIMVKGLDITNVGIIDDGTLSDHCGIYADVVITELEAQQ